MGKKYLDDNGLLYFWQKVRSTFVSDVTWDSTNKKLVRKMKTGTNGAEQSSDIVTFSTVATSGSYNDLSNKPTIPTLKNVFGKVKVGDSTIEADTTQDTLEMVAGSNVTLTADTTNDKVTIAATDTTYSAATGSADGLISSAHYTKLEGIASGAEVNVQADWNEESSSSDAYIKNKPTIPTLKNVFGKVKVGSSTIEAETTQDTLELYAGSNITLTADTTNDKVTIAATDTTYSAATGSADGLMSSTHYTKLEGIASGAEVNVQSDWNQTTDSADDFIKNKPTLGGAAAKGVVSSISADSNDLPTVTAVKQYVSTAVSGGAAFQGTAPTTFAPTNYVAGWYWVVGTAGTYVGQTCEAGDMIFATANYSSAYSADDFDVIQTNLDITSISNAEIDTIVAA